MSVSLATFQNVSSLSSYNKRSKTEIVKQPQLKHVWVFRPTGKMAKSIIDRVEAWRGSQGWELLGIIYKTSANSNGYNSVINGLKILSSSTQEIPDIDAAVRLIAETQAIIQSDPSPTMHIIICNA